MSLRGYLGHVKCRVEAWFGERAGHKPETSPEGANGRGRGAESDEPWEEWVLLWGLEYQVLPWDPKGKNKKGC